jgi:hypothetical protein
LDLPLYFDDRLLKPATRGGRTYFAFGEDGPGVVLLATEAGHNEVFSVPPDGPSTFVNSSISDFVNSYGVFAQRNRQIIELPHEEGNAVIGEVLELIAARDAETLEPDGWLSWWDELLSSMEGEEA